MTVVFKRSNAGGGAEPLVRVFDGKFKFTSLWDSKRRKNKFRPVSLGIKASFPRITGKFPLQGTLSHILPEICLVFGKM
jgi:hypothetical protein